MDHCNNQFVNKGNLPEEKIANFNSIFLNNIYYPNLFEHHNTKDNIHNNNYSYVQKQNFDLYNDLESRARNIHNFSSVSNYYFPQENLFNNNRQKINNSNINLSNINLFDSVNIDFLHENEFTLNSGTEYHYVKTTFKRDPETNQNYFVHTVIAKPGRRVNNLLAKGHFM